MRKPLTVIVTAVIVLVVDLALERFILPFLYGDLPSTFPSTSKPIGGILLPATFFHLILAVPSLLIIFYAAEKAGYNVASMLPKSKQSKLEYGFLMLLLISGMALWYYPIALFPFMLSGLYLLIAEIR